jgi:hypothetical protein
VNARLVAATALALSSAAAAQTPGSIGLTVAETAGIRRTSYPVSVEVPLPAGALHDPAHARLVEPETGSEVPAQFGVASRRPDGSIQSLAVDFNATIGAAASDRYRIEYGPDVSAAPPPRPLSVVETGDAIQIGNIRLGKSGAPLLESVKYRGEDIAPGVNGFRVVDDHGLPRDLSDVIQPSVEVLARGPLVARVRYSGEIAFEPHAGVAFTLDVEIPRSKSWVKLAATVDDPSRRVTEIAFETPLALGPLPWTWEVGTDRGTYGALRRTEDRMLFAERLTGPGRATWQARVNGGDGLAIVETTGEQAAPVARWAHLESAGEAVAFAIEVPPDTRGTYRVAFDASGQAAIAFARALPATRHRLTVYEHFVATPLAIGAATSPAAALSPLKVTVDQ